MQRLLAAHGYDLVAVNLRVGRLELDIVARHERTIVIVEVRHRGRGSWERPLGSIGHKKRQRIRRAGQRLWRARYQNDSSVDRMRFDAVSVTYDRGEFRLEHVVAAF